MSTNLLSLFAVPVHVKRLPAAEMPQDLLGAYVVCYVSAADHLRALKLAIEALSSDHYQFLEMSGDISQLDPNYWGAYVGATWPEAVGSLPTQSEVLARLGSEDVFYGPFCGYDNEDDEEPAS